MADFLSLVGLTVMLVFSIVCFFVLVGRISKAIRRRRCFARRGIHWQEACAAVARGEGYLVFDHIIGRCTGLADIVIWWLPSSVPTCESVAGQILACGRLTDCPRAEISLASLRQRFGDEKVIENLELISIDELELS
jgi:hypothetical protein